jgi:hypothetical protein
MSKPLHIQTIEAARALIADKENWFGNSPIEYGKGKTRNCAWLAILHSSADHNTYSSVELFIQTHFGTSTGTLVSYNNTHKHEEVLALFDKALGKGDGGVGSGF